MASGLNHINKSFVELSTIHDCFITPTSTMIVSSVGEYKLGLHEGKRYQQYSGYLAMISK